MKSVFQTSRFDLKSGFEENRDNNCVGGVRGGKQQNPYPPIPKKIRGKKDQKLLINYQFGITSNLKFPGAIKSVENLLLLNKRQKTFGQRLREGTRRLSSG